MLQQVRLLLRHKGTLITIPANAFVTLGGFPVTGTVNIEYKELYKKSDMLFSDKPTVLFDGSPLKSGGDIFYQSHFKRGRRCNLLREITLPCNNLLMDSRLIPA